MTGVRLPHQDRLNIAVFIDFDNIEIGVKSTLGEHFDVGTILDAIKERGEVVTKIAYADWTRAGEYSRTRTSTRTSSWGATATSCRWSKSSSNTTRKCLSSAAGHSRASSCSAIATS